MNPTTTPLPRGELHVLLWTVYNRIPPEPRVVPFQISHERIDVMNFPALEEIYELLLHIDTEYAQSTRETGCPTCGATVHSARYPRKLRGLPAEHLERLDTDRFSFCCSREGCRRRVTPPSVRFLDRRVYLGMVVALVTAVRQGPTPPGLSRLNALVGADRRTILRWRQWWQERFPSSSVWILMKGRLMPMVPDSQIPRGVMDAFSTDCPVQRMLLFLKFLASAAATMSTMLEGPRRPAEFVPSREKRLLWG